MTLQQRRVARHHHKEARRLFGPDSRTCVVCRNSADTGLGFKGDAAWCVDGLRHLGLPAEAAVATFMLIYGGVPEGEVPMPLVVCESCATAAHLNVRPLALGVPVYSPES